MRYLVDLQDALGFGTGDPYSFWFLRRARRKARELAPDYHSSVVVKRYDGRIVDVFPGGKAPDCAVAGRELRLPES